MLLHHPHPNPNTMHKMQMQGKKPVYPPRSDGGNSEARHPTTNGHARPESLFVRCDVYQPNIFYKREEPNNFLIFDRNEPKKSQFMERKKGIIHFFSPNETLNYTIGMEQRIFSLKKENFISLLSSSP
jgi:hypothetical protein